MDQQVEWNPKYFESKANTSFFNLAFELILEFFPYLKKKKGGWDSCAKSPSLTFFNNTELSQPFHLFFFFSFLRPSKSKDSGKGWYLQIRLYVILIKSTALCFFQYKTVYYKSLKYWMVP